VAENRLESHPLAFVLLVSGFGDGWDVLLRCVLSSFKTLGLPLFFIVAHDAGHMTLYGSKILNHTVGLTLHTVNSYSILAAYNWMFVLVPFCAVFLLALDAPCSSCKAFSP